MTLSTSRTIHFIIATALMFIMAFTRSAHFGSAVVLPDASWAIFFLAGLYLQSVIFLPVLLLQAGFIDYIAIQWGGVSSFCITPAYFMLIPAYAALWQAGRFVRTHASARIHLGQLALAAVIGISLCFILSSGSFYFFSDQVVNPGWSGFISQSIQYMPGYLTTTLLYIGAALALHKLLQSLTPSLPNEIKNT